ncbi:MAG: type II toxin-antitoxin system RelE/ParE family toxin [bacterium]
MNYAFHPEAETELAEAIDFYEDREAGLGEDFALEVQYTIQNILSYPRAWPAVADDVRRCLTHRFPYGVLYSIEPDRVYVVAVMHLRRKPRYWKRRR